MHRHGREAAGGILHVRHRPEESLLYRLLEQHYPAYVEKEFDACLKCGRLEHGFLRVRCESCHFERLVAFSCKRRGLLRASCPPPLRDQPAAVQNRIRRFCLPQLRRAAHGGDRRTACRRGAAGDASQAMGDQEFITPYTPEQNGMIERIFRSLKEECTWQHSFTSFKEAKRTIDRWIAWYNEERPHQALGYLSPVEFRAQQLNLVA